MKTIALLFSIFFISHINAQEICDDLIIYDEWEFETYSSIDWNYGDTIGYFADGILPITVVKDYGETPTGELFLDGSQPGIFGYNMGVQFNFMGEEQTVTLQVYVDAGVLYSQYGFYINESDSILLDAEFPLTVDGILIDMENLGIIEDTYELLELSFTGFIDSIQYQPNASGIIEICSYLPEGASILENNILHTAFYPNPCQDQLIIESEFSLNTVLIYNSLGEIISSVNFEYSYGIHSINTANFNTGIYLVEVHYSNGLVEQKKLIKQ